MASGGYAWLSDCNWRRLPRGETMPDPRRTHSVEGAVELMTAWLATPDGPPDLLLQTLERRIEEHPSGDRLVAAVELVMGMTRLCGSLLVLREMEDGVTGDQTIRDLALGIAEAEGFESDFTDRDQAGPR